MSKIILAIFLLHLVMSVKQAPSGAVYFMSLECHIKSNIHNCILWQKII